MICGQNFTFYALRQRVIQTRRGRPYEKNSDARKQAYREGIEKNGHSYSGCCSYIVKPCLYGMVLLY